MFVLPFGAIVMSLPLLKSDISANCNAVLTGGIFLYSAQYIACCPCLGWYCFIPGQCLLNFSTALESAQFLPVMCAPKLVVNDCFLPAMCTPQKEWFKRARSFLDVCLTTSMSMLHTRIVTLAWGGLRE
jgi:hypothetical protein